MTSYDSDGSDFCDIFRTSKERAMVMVPYIKKSIVYKISWDCIKHIDYIS